MRLNWLQVLTTVRCVYFIYTSGALWSFLTEKCCFELKKKSLLHRNVQKLGDFYGIMYVNKKKNELMIRAG